jgi:murein DD-endopeptidase MepM/ murein hydrolase activator NlpD
MSAHEVDGWNLKATPEDDLQRHSKWFNVPTKGRSLQDMVLKIKFLTALIYSLFVAVAFADATIFEGDFIQGGLVTGRTLPGAHVTFNDRRVRVSKDGLFLIGFGRDAPGQAKVDIELPDGSHHTRTFKVKKRQYKIQYIKGLPPRKVTPSKEDLERIRAEAALVRKAREIDDPRTDFLTGFRWPVEGKITGVYGSQRVLNGKPRRPHFGVDIAAPVGTAVLAPADGMVTLVYPDMYFSGGTVILDHGHGLSSSFLHLSKILVTKGQAISRGEIIAEVGAMGRVTGAHLDWRINLFQVRLDPQLLMSPMSGL